MKSKFIRRTPTNMRCKWHVLGSLFPALVFSKTIPVQLFLCLENLLLPTLNVILVKSGIFIVILVRSGKREYVSKKKNTVG